jgi:hypothetical protein
LLGEVFPENVITQVYDCLSEAAQDELDVDVEVNGTLYAALPAAGSVDIPVINTATTPIGTVTPGVDVEIPDSAISVDSTPELNLPATVALNILLSDGVNPITPVSVTPGAGTLTIVVPASGFDTIRLQFQPYANEARYDITAADAGTYNNPTDDGGSGTVTWSINGGAFAAWPGATALVATDYIIAKRTTASALGWAQIEQ